MSLYKSYIEKAEKLKDIGNVEKSNSLYEAAHRIRPIDYIPPAQPQSYIGNILDGVFDGSTFPGSMGSPKINWTDYYTLRLRSTQLFQENLYCKGLIRRLITNEIHTGLNLEAHPVHTLIGLSEKESMEWANDREIDWNLWANDAEQCDFKRKKNLHELAADCRMTALISGDCLEVFRINKKTGLPAIELIDGSHIKTPFGKKPRAGNKIVHGVELDKDNRHVAFWVQIIKDNTDNLDFQKLDFKRIVARGEKSGRLVAKLIYGTEQRLDDVRGEPMLANVLYMIGELKKGMDSEQRAFTINAMLAYFIENEGDQLSNRPSDAGASKTGSTDVTQPDGSVKPFQYSQNVPGMVFQDLPKGRKPVAFNSQRPNAGIKQFEELIIDAISWSIELPPEILRLKFQSNFSASRQANNEFDNYLAKRYVKFGKDFYQPVYEMQTIQSVRMGRVSAPGMLEAWRKPKERNIYLAWVNAEWNGLSRPSVDMNKEVSAAAKALDYGIGSGDFWNRRITGQNIFASHKQRRREIDFDIGLDLSFASEENQNKEPIQEGGTQEPNNGNDNGNNNQSNEIANARLMKMLKQMNNNIEDLKNEIEDFKMEAVNG